MERLVSVRPGSREVEAWVLWFMIAASTLFVVPVHGAAQDSLTGCYDLELGPWTSDIPSESDSLYVTPPPRIRLDSAQGRGLGDRPQNFALTPAPGALPSLHRYSWWKWTSPDSIELAWTTGLSGLRMHLAVEGSVLSGIAETFWDFTRERQRAQAVATPVACDSALPEEERMSYRFPRGIGFEDADSVLLGLPLPRTGLDVEEEDGRIYEVHRVRGRFAAPFEEAESARVAVDPEEGAVRRIRVRYPEGEDYDRIIERMVAAFGQPTNRWSRELDSGYVSWMTSWSGRLVSIGAYGGRNDRERAVTVLFVDLQAR